MPAAAYDLTFRVPKQDVVISVGTLDKQEKEGNFAVSHWVTPIPVAVAGFNMGEYDKIPLPDPVPGMHLEGYYLEQLPDILRPFRDFQLSGMDPKSMTQVALQEARAQMQLCTFYFGKIPYDHVYITEQPNMFFGQSWPNLIYLPVIAYMDSTQRWRLFGMSKSLTGFIQEVTPHEVSHQWWGHAVGWSTYHDQWLSEGFAEFSAGLFLQQAKGGKWQNDYTEFWDRQRRKVLDKDSFGIAPTDAGPIWLGLRLISPKSEDSYTAVTYAKGAFVLNMLRSIMWGSDGNPKKEQAFIDMMHEFVAAHANSPASTESFKAIAEKHMTKEMDLQGNHSLDWFFNEWVYGTMVPRYKFSYETQPADKGAVKIHVTLTQSEVDENFGMLLPIYADFGHGMTRLAQVPIIGNSTRTYDLIVPTAPKKVAFNVFKEILERN